MRQVGEGCLSRAMEFEKALSQDVNLVIATIDGQLGEWVMLIRGSASPTEALSVLEARVDRLTEWLRP